MPELATIMDSLKQLPFESLLVFVALAAMALAAMALAAFAIHAVASVVRERRRD